MGGSGARGYADDESSEGPAPNAAGRNLSVIVPTLNEERDLPKLLRSIREQTQPVFEIIVVDGGSTDETTSIANEYGATVAVVPGLGEYGARNLGASLAKGDFLVNVGADTVWPPTLVERIMRHLAESPDLVGLSGPGIPLDPPTWAKVEYFLFNLLRVVVSHWGRFVTSTNFLVCPADLFAKLGGFVPNDINADGKFGRRLQRAGRIRFASDLGVFISSRRMRNAGPLVFNKTFLYVMENLAPRLEGSQRFQGTKRASENHHLRDSGGD